MKHALGEKLLRKLRDNPEMLAAFQRSGQKILEGGKSGARELMMIADKLSTIMRDDDKDVLTEAEIIYKMLQMIPVEKRDEMIRAFDHQTLVLLVHYMDIRLRFITANYKVDDF